MLRHRMSCILLVGCCAFRIVLGPLALAADADNGKTLANRWCSSCHVVDHEQIHCKEPSFDARRLAFLLLRPHPNMPKLELSRAEIADLADYIATLK